MVQQGLEVDVKRLLGTGVESDEQEWFAVLRELQEDGKVARGRRGAFDGENEVEGKRGGQG